MICFTAQKWTEIMKSSERNSTSGPFGRARTGLRRSRFGEQTGHQGQELAPS